MILLGLLPHLLIMVVKLLELMICGVDYGEINCWCKILTVSRDQKEVCYDLLAHLYFGFFDT